ncbi:MAG: D-Ala-D-Ala carboxypeptidase family metallohydrolase [Pseudomonadota bacterium]
MDWIEADHWAEVAEADWRWANFSPHELACRGTGQLKVHVRSLDRLQQLRDRLGAPMIITSAYRSPMHNARVGGARRSMHLLGRAFDVSMANHDPRAFEAAAREVGFTGFGFYPSQGFMHIDTRGWSITWGTPFQPRGKEKRFARETPHGVEAGEREDLAA